MLDNKDYINRINKARKKRKSRFNPPYMVMAGAAAVLVLAIGIAGMGMRKQSSEKAAGGSVIAASDGGEETKSPESTAPEETTTISEEQRLANEAAMETEAVLASYQNLGMAQVSGYLNIRKSAGKDAEVIGKLTGDGACEILEDTGDGWYKVSSGGIEGYLSSEYVITGEEARDKAKSLVKQYAIIQTEKLNIRKEPNTEAETVGQALINERYEFVSQDNGWIQISQGYLSADYVEIRYALNEAKKLDLKAMVLNLYDNLGISKVDNYLNIRSEPKEDGKVIGKMTSKSAGNILETTDNGWYKIQSGGITGYVKSDYILTGAAAKDEAVQVAELMAVVSTDMLNARTEPNTSAPIWTQISNNQRYRVLNQTDGWVEIELEENTNAFVATDFVDVRYDLPEAIKFSPLEEKANQAASLRTQIVNYALQFLGNPYVWGGTSLTKGADCSGFTLSVFKKYGVSLPHYSGSQAQMGKAVSSSEMRPGDLVFYADKKGTINHVGIYIGNGQIVNAASRKSGIKISTWNYRKPVKIRNILGD